MERLTLDEVWAKMDEFGVLETIDYFTNRGWMAIHMMDVQRGDITWFGDRGLSWKTDVVVKTYRHPDRSINSHVWFFKDHGQGLLFSITFAGCIINAEKQTGPDVIRERRHSQTTVF